MMIAKYIVGSHRVDENDVTDTDMSYAEDGFSNYLTSHGQGEWKFATRYETFEEADAWRKEALGEDVEGNSCGKVYRIYV